MRFSSPVHAAMSNQADHPSRSGRVSTGCTGSRWTFADPETNEYFAALSSDLGPLTRSATGRRRADQGGGPRGAGRPARCGRAVRRRPSAGTGPHVAWCRRTDTSTPGCLIGSRPQLRTVDGESLEVAEIGSITPDPANIGGSVLDWLTAQARDRRIEVHQATSLQRIVFEEGDVVGAVFATPDGPLAVRARHGVTVASGGPQVTMAAGQPLPADDATLRVCLVGQDRQPLRSRRAADLRAARRCAPHPPAVRTIVTCTRTCTRRTATYRRGAAEKSTGIRPLASRASIASPTTGRDNRNPCAR